MNEIYKLVKELLISGIAGLIAALFAIQLSLRKFSSQKWWERREQAYSKIIGILSSLRVYLGKWEEDVLKERELKQVEKQELFTKMRQEREKIEQVASEGAFRITEKSNEALDELVKSLGRYGKHPMEGIEIHNEAVSKCLDIIQTEAKRDLRINKKWYQI